MKAALCPRTSVETGAAALLNTNEGAAPQQLPHIPISDPLQLLFKAVWPSPSPDLDRAVGK